MLYGLVKSQKNNLLSFRRKPESSNFNMFWMPDQVRHDGIRLFTRASRLQASKWVVAGIIFLLLLFSSCSKKIPEQRFVTENAQYDLLITGVTSEFKADIISRIIDRYKDQGNVDLIDLNKLDQLQCGDYDAILVMDSVQAGSLFNFSLKSFLKKTENCKNIVLLYTAGDPDWKYQYHELDAITSASMVEDQDRVFNELTYAIDVLIFR